MESTVFRRYAAIAAANLRHNFLPHLLLALGVLALTPVIFGINDLDAQAAAVPLECFASLIGAILLTPIFLPEDDPQVYETVSARYTGCLPVWILRTLYSLAAAAVLLGGFTLLMRGLRSEVSLSLYFGALSSAAFLGGRGVLAGGASGNVAVGYMLPVMYYVFSWMGGQKMLGMFQLFSITMGDGSGKGWLLAGGLLLTAAGLTIRSLRR